MKLHLLFVACMTLFIISCGENDSGKKKDKDRTGTLMVNKGTNDPQCQSVGMALLNYKGSHYQIEQTNQQLMNQIYQLAQQAYYGGGQNTSGGNGTYPNGFNGGGNPYNGYNGGSPYNNGGYYQQIGSDACTVHYRIEFEGRGTNNNDNGYGGYNYMPTMNITSYRIR